MSKLESKVIPILGPMIRDGRATKLDAAAQKLLATWAIKTAFMLEYLHPTERVVPDSEYHSFYAVKQPPRGYVVWLAHRMAYTDGTGRELLVSSLEETINQVNVDPSEADQVDAWHTQGHVVYGITFMIGRVVFQVFGHNFPGSFRIDQPPLKVTQWIWPVQGDVTWPPPVPIETIGGMEGLHKAFNPPPPPQQAAP